MTNELKIKENNTGVPPIKSGQLFRLTAAVHNFLLEANKKECDITFDFILMSLFPKVYDNIKESLSKSYINGWNEGRAALLKEQEDENSNQRNS